MIRSTLVVVLATVVMTVAGPMGGLVFGPAPASAATVMAKPSISPWTATEAQLPANAAATPLASLSTVACPVTGSCVATGDYTDTSANQQGLIETLTSGAWTAQEAPVPGDAATDPLVSLGAVVCPVTGSCVATGTYTDTSDHQQGLIETLASGTWTALKAPLPANAAADPQVSVTAPVCPADGSCVVTANYSITGGPVRSTIDTLSAGVWTPSEAPLPPNAAAGSGSSIGGAACPADGSCVAMAEYTDTGSNAQTAVETLAAGNWTALEAPTLPAVDIAPTGHQRNFLVSVNCAGPGTCTAVGSFAPAAGSFQGLIETLSGGTWTASEAPLPADAPAMDAFAQLDVVTCPDADDCISLGWYYDSGGNYHALLETQSGGTWTPVPQPLPARPVARNPNNPDEGIGNAACVASGSCVAVGSYFDAAHKDKSIIETLAGGSWTTIKAPLPSKADANLISALHDVTCASDGTCVAVGSANGIPLIETLPGGNASPSVTSANQVTFTIDQAGTFTVTASGTPAPSLSKKGKLPKGLHFVAGTGSATIAGTPLGSAGTFHVVIEAQNGVLPTASQFLTVTITT